MIAKASFSAAGFKTAFSYPLKAVASIKFYFDVLFKMRGLGFVYLLFLCVFLAIPCAYKVTSLLKSFDSLNLPGLILEIPKSTISADGVLTPNDPAEEFTVLEGPNGRPVVVFNPKDRQLSSDEAAAPVEMASQTVRFRTPKGVTIVRYKDLVPQGSDFDPVYVADIVRSVFGVSVPTVWSMLVLWFFAVLIFNSVISGCLAKFFMFYAARVRIFFGPAIRMCAFASTLSGIFMLGQFMLDMEISYSVMLMIPLFYILFFCRAFRTEYNNLGPEGFRDKYGFKDEQRVRADEIVRRRRVDELSGRGQKNAQPERTVEDLQDDEETEDLRRMDGEPSEGFEDAPRESDSVTPPPPPPGADAESSKSDSDKKDGGTGFFAP